VAERDAYSRHQFRSEGSWIPVRPTRSWGDRAWGADVS